MLIHCGVVLVGGLRRRGEQDDILRVFMDVSNHLAALESWRRSLARGTPIARSRLCRRRTPRARVRSVELLASPSMDTLPRSLEPILQRLGMPGNSVLRARILCRLQS